MLAEERETVIRLGYSGDREVSVYSTQRVVWAKMERAGWKLAMQDRWGREYVGDADMFRFSVKSRENRDKERIIRSEAAKARMSFKKEAK